MDLLIANMGTGKLICINVKILVHFIKNSIHIDTKATVPEQYWLLGLSLGFSTKLSR